MVILTGIPVNAAEESSNSDDDKYRSPLSLVIGTIAAAAGISIKESYLLSLSDDIFNGIIEGAQSIYNGLYDRAVEVASSIENSNSSSSPAEGGFGGRHRVSDDLNSIAGRMSPYNSIKSDIDSLVFSSVAQSVLNYLDSVSAGYELIGDVSVKNGVVDLRHKNTITFTFPPVSGSYTVVSFPVNNCYFTYYINLSDATKWLLMGYSSEGYSTQIVNGQYVCRVEPHGYDIYFTFSFWQPSSSSFNNAVMTNIYDVNPFVDNSGALCFDVNSNIPDVHFLHRWGFFVSGADHYRIASYNGLWAFVNIANSSDIYKGLTFSSALGALQWFMSLCGIDFSGTNNSDYYRDTSATPVVIDNTKVEQTISNITNNYHEGDTVSMVYPSYYITNNYYNYDDYVKNPDLIFDFSQDGLYKKDIYFPSSDGNKWANKFPFCLPFDIYHLISNFSAEPEAPELHMLVLPANAFGMQNDDFYIDFDFADYNILVQILRFFIAIGFVIWLIVITNKLLQ